MKCKFEIILASYYNHPFQTTEYYTVFQVAHRKDNSSRYFLHLLLIFATPRVEQGFEYSRYQDCSLWRRVRRRSIRIVCSHNDKPRHGHF